MLAPGALPPGSTASARETEVGAGSLWSQSIVLSLCCAPYSFLFKVYLFEREPASTQASSVGEEQRERDRETPNQTPH